MSLTLKQITKRWQSAIKSAIRSKKKSLEAGRRCMRFYANADHSFLYTQAYQETSTGLRVKDEFDFDGMAFRGTINLTSNAAAVFIPVLFHKYPTRTAEPRLCNLDMNLLAMAGVPVMPTDMQQLQQSQARLQLASQLIEHRLNATPERARANRKRSLSCPGSVYQGQWRAGWCDV